MEFTPLLADEAVGTRPAAGGDLVAEANHRAANSLALLGGLVRMQARAIGKNSRSYTRIATIGQLHRLLASIPAQGAIPLHAHLREVGANLITAFSSEERQARIEYRGADCLVPARHVQSLTLIVCEILTNAMKYAHPTGIAVEMTVSCESRSDGMLVLSISDDGVGLPEDFDPSKDGGIGFQIIRTLASQIGAKLDIASDNVGVTFRIAVSQALVANARTA
jgi:two-component sensor histidine kinase